MAFTPQKITVQPGDTFPVNQNTYVVLGGDQAPFACQEGSIGNGRVLVKARLLKNGKPFGPTRKWFQDDIAR